MIFVNFPLVIILLLFFLVSFVFKISFLCCNILLSGCPEMMSHQHYHDNDEDNTNQHCQKWRLTIVIIIIIRLCLSAVCYFWCNYLLIVNVLVILFFYFSFCGFIFLLKGCLFVYLCRFIRRFFLFAFFLLVSRMFFSLVIQYSCHFRSLFMFCIFLTFNQLKFVTA